MIENVLVLVLVLLSRLIGVGLRLDRLLLIRLLLIPVLSLGLRVVLRRRRSRVLMRRRRRRLLIPEIRSLGLRVVLRRLLIPVPVNMGLCVVLILVRTLAVRSLLVVMSLTLLEIIWLSVLV